MINFLETILARKREEIQVEQKRTSIEQLQDRPLFSVQSRSLAAALGAEGVAVIAEIKKASPSKGVIRNSFNHKEIARQYADGGASALSVLTDEPFFQGKRSYLEEVRALVSLPLLRKDFIIDSYQMYESKAYGADAVLLIAAALDPKHLNELHAEAVELGLECLVEIHSEEELASLSGIKLSVIGVNNRNLSTFETDLSTSVRLKPLLPNDAIAVSESGITSADDVRLLVTHGYHAVLIGETLMKSDDPGNALQRLISEASAR
jgi:indole-3-glycerol phosphate synthase